jgi:2-polyprenyl-6-hydroxyphenyl methylase/3-demethylubiquinone-9 3-methyltransferase
MRKVEYSDSWLDSWKSSYKYDLLEIYGEDRTHGYVYAYANRRKHTIELVKKVASPGAKILDVAAAQGNFSLLLAELGYEVTWNDFRGELIDYVKLKHERGLIHYAPGNIFDINFNVRFDVVLITEVIEHVAHPDDLLKIVSKFVVPGGSIVMTTPNGGYFLNRLPKFSECLDASVYELVQFQPNSDGHIFLLHIGEVEQLAHQANLSVQEIRLFTNPLTNGHIKLGSALKMLPRRLVDRCERLTNSLPLSIQKKMHTGMAVLLNQSG